MVMYLFQPSSRKNWKHLWKKWLIPSDVPALPTLLLPNVGTVHVRLPLKSDHLKVCNNSDIKTKPCLIPKVRSSFSLHVLVYLRSGAERQGTNCHRKYVYFSYVKFTFVTHHTSHKRNSCVKLKIKPSVSARLKRKGKKSSNLSHI